MPLHILLVIYAALVGLMIGSYLNVVIYRLPRGISTVLPRSRCPGCGHPIRARDNLPVLSFLLLRGRCRACGAPIGWTYPLVEAATALLFAGCLWRFGPTLSALAAALFCCLMLVLAVIDARHLILPDRITLPGILLGLAIQPWLPWDGLWSAAAGTLLGAGVLLAMWAGWYLLRREEGMGLGDVKMLALIGAFLGWRAVLVALFFAALTGAATGIALIWSGGAGMQAGLKTKLPFGSFLALGGLIALFAGPQITGWYARML